MEVRLEKIIEAMSVLNVTADHLIKTHGEDHVAVMLAGECIKSAAALRAAMHMSELEYAQVTGELQ
jgi:ABC-type dipeptide/oligopeptide/nickel transport system ATPase component